MRSKRIIRVLVILLPVLWLVWGPPARQAQQPPGAAAFDQAIKPFLTEHCYDCHNARNASGGLNLTALQGGAAIGEESERWEYVLLKLQTGEMPPKGMPRPAPAAVKTVIAWIEHELARADSLAKPDPGRVTARRLNRAEYNNTVRDLLGVQLRPADEFPQDDSGYGFDNIGDVLSVSPLLVEKYLAAAEKVARTALFGAEQLKPTLTELRGQGRRIVPGFTPQTDYDTTGLNLPNALHVSYRFPVEAEYSFRLFLTGARPAGSEAVKFALWIDGQQAEVRELDPEGRASFSENRQDFDAFTLDLRAPVTPGEHWIAASVLNLYEGLPPSYNGPNPSKKPQPPLPEFKPRPDVPPEVNERRRKAFEDRLKDRPPVNNVRITRVDIGGPYKQRQGPAPESLKKIYICGHFDGQHQATCASKIVRNLAHRAYRRPVTSAEVNQLTGLIALAQQKGDSFEEGLCVALQAMLVSPHFLFRIEQDHPATAENSYQLGPHELASRLSYFLWSSMPDDELLRAADQGTLRQPAVLTAQVQRMLKDEKARALVENFGGQWLELRKLEAAKPDQQKFPEFDEYLRRSIRRETELFLENIIREDRSILDFIDAKYSFLNERLAQLYQIPGVKGPEFRRVSLAGHAERGGVLTQASILTISSYTTRTSPVLRGKWILENILNAPPPPPPPDVPKLDESKVGTAGSLRQQLEEHRKNPICASCHNRLDPLGFGLEKFDAIGAWRTQDGKFPIDDTGTLPDGRTFHGPAELRTILLADRDRFAQGLTEKLLTYGLGRGLERYDKPVVKKIASAVATQNYRFSSLVLEIVQSLPFQKRRGVATS
jgi:mono/diheme cytochrome c family protein